MASPEEVGQATEILADYPDNVMGDHSKKDEDGVKVSDVEKDGSGSSGEVVITKTTVVQTVTVVESTFDSSPRLVDMEKDENGGLSCAVDRSTSPVAGMNNVLGAGEKNKADIADVVAGSPVDMNDVGDDGEKLKMGGEKCVEAVLDSNDKKQGIDGEKREDSISTFRVGDFVWGKIKSHPWWPGQIYDPEDASDFAVKHSQEGRLLVAYFGDGSCSWCLPSQLVPFVENFKRMLTDSSSKSYQNAIHYAVNDLGRLVESSLTCKCVPLDKREGLARPMVSNAGIKEGVLVPDVDVDQVCLPNYGPTQILEKLASYAKSYSLDSLLELAVVRSWLSAFYRASGGHMLPVYCEPTYIEGLEDKNKPMKVASAEDFSIPIEVPILGPREDDWLSSPVVKSQASADDKIYHRRKQKSVAELMGEDNKVRPKSQKRTKEREEKDLRKSELEKGKAGKKRKVEIVSDGDKSEDGVKESHLSGKPKEIEVGIGESISGDELEKVSSPRERKKSKYLSPPYTNPSFSFANFSSKVKLESDKSTKRDRAASPPTPKPVDGAFDEEPPVAQLKEVDASAQTLKSGNKLICSASDVDLQVGELLSEVQFAALDPMYLSKKGSLDPVCAFVSAVRKSTYLQGSDHEILQKAKPGEKKRKSMKDQETGIFPKKAKPADDPKTPKPAKNNEGRKSDKSKSKKSSDLSHAENSVENFKGSSATMCLIVTFSPGFPLPSKEDILGLYGKFGNLNEKETSIVTESHAVRIVYTNESDAEAAFISSVRESPFGGKDVNYWLQHSSSCSKSGPMISPRAFNKSGPSQLVDDFMMDIGAIRQKLEIMTAIVENYHSKFSSEEKSGLKDEMKQLMENVEAVSDKVRVMAENTTSS